MSTLNVSLEDFDAARVDELVRLWRASFEDGVGITDPHPIEDQRNYFLNEVLPRNTVRLALNGPQMMGFIAASAESVAQLHVRLGFLRRGIGSLMLNWAKSQSNGHLWLYTFARNRRACAFYEKHGFRVAARGFEHTWQLDDVRYEWSAGGQLTDGSKRTLA